MRSQTTVDVLGLSNPQEIESSNPSMQTSVIAGGSRAVFTNRTLNGVLSLSLRLTLSPSLSLSALVLQDEGWRLSLEFPVIAKCKSQPPYLIYALVAGAVLICLVCICCIIRYIRRRRRFQYDSSDEPTAYGMGMRDCWQRCIAARLTGTFQLARNLYKIITDRRRSTSVMER